MTLTRTTPDGGFRRARRLRRVLPLIACAAVLVAGIWYLTAQLPPYVQQSRCSRFTLPPGTVVFANDPATMAQLLLSPDYGLVNPTPGFPDRAAAGRVSPSLDPHFKVGAIFIHRLRTAEDYNERLVLVGVSYYSLTSSDELTWICADSFNVVSPLPGSNDRQRAHGWYMLRARPGERLRLFAGRPLANDPTGFTFDYELGGAHGTIDGWLHDDSKDGVVLRDRTGWVLTQTQSPDGTEPAQ